MKYDAQHVIGPQGLFPLSLEQNNFVYCFKMNQCHSAISMQRLVFGWSIR